MQNLKKLTPLMECIQRTCVQPEDTAFRNSMQMKALELMLDKDMQAYGRMATKDPTDMMDMMELSANILNSKKVRKFIASCLNDYSKYIKSRTPASMKKSMECFMKDCKMDPNAIDKIIATAEALYGLLNDPEIKRAAAGCMKSYGDNIQKMKKVRAVVVTNTATAATVTVKKTKAASK